MKEIDFYEEIAKKWVSELIKYVGEDVEFAYSLNKPLKTMISSIEEQLKGKTKFNEHYIPLLQLDILLGFKRKDELKIDLILFEVKYAKNLGLADFSQLAGYLQVAKRINKGILLLVEQNKTENTLSNDFAEIVHMKSLPLKWELSINDISQKTNFQFHSGICSFVPGNGFRWIKSKSLSGINSFQDLVDLMTFF